MRSSTRRSVNARSAGAVAVAAHARAVQRKVRESVRNRRAHARPDQDALRTILALELAGNFVQLGQGRALGVRQQELERHERLLEGGLDPIAKLLESLALERGGGDRIRIADRELGRVARVEEVDLVVHAEPGDVIGPDLLEHGVDRGDCIPALMLGLRGIHDMKSEEHTLNSSHQIISYAVFCLKKKKK